MDIDSAFPGSYLKAADILGKQVRVTIDHVEVEDVGGGDHKPVAYFQGKERGLVLNKTNANIIKDMYGRETGQWIGKPIILYTAKVEFSGRLVDAIRVQHPGMAQPYQPQSAPPAQSQIDPDLDNSIPF